MTPVAIIREAAADGVSLALSPAGTIKATGDQAAVNRWLPILREHKPAMLAALAHSNLSPAALAELPPEDAACPWWRVSIVGPRALNIELEMRTAWTVSDWGRFARRHYGPDATVVARARPDPEPVTEEAAAEGLRVTLSGVSPEFAARLSAEDLEDIAAGDIPMGTVQAFEQAAIARETEDLQEFFEERAGILEFDAGLPRPDAELEAARITATLARNRGFLWASLRAALAGYPALSAQVPDRPSPVDSLPFGTARVHVREGASPAPSRAVSSSSPRPRSRPRARAASW